MIRTIPSPASGLISVGRHAMSTGGKVASLLAAFLGGSLFGPEARAGTVQVAIYGTYDADNAPSGGPYSGLAGHLSLSSDVFTGLGYSFGNPFGLSSFAAVVSFTQYMSTSGLYLGGLNSGASPVLWTKGGAMDPYGDGPWAAGSAYNEVFFNAGYNDFELVFLAGDNFGDGFGGEVPNLSLDYFQPWGGDPGLGDGAYSYVTTTLSVRPAVLTPVEVPDSASTLMMLAGSFAAIFAIGRKMGRRSAAG